MIQTRWSAGKEMKKSRVIKFIKEPWATLLAGLLLKLAILSKKSRQIQKKNIKTSKKSKHIQKSKKIKKHLEKLKNSLKNTKKGKRNWSGSEAGAKRQARKPWNTLKKHWNHRIRFVPAPLPLRSRFVPAPFPLQARGVLTLPWSFQCLGAKGLLPRKNHQKILGVLALPWSFQLIYIYYIIYIPI